MAVDSKNISTDKLYGVVKKKHDQKDSVMLQVLSFLDIEDINELKNDRKTIVLVIGNYQKKNKKKKPSPKKPSPKKPSPKKKPVDDSSDDEKDTKRDEPVSPRSKKAEPGIIKLDSKVIAEKEKAKIRLTKEYFSTLQQNKEKCKQLGQESLCSELEKMLGDVETKISNASTVEQVKEYLDSFVKEYQVKFDQIKPIVKAIEKDAKKDEKEMDADIKKIEDKNTSQKEIQEVLRKYDVAVPENINEIISEVEKCVMAKN